MVSNGDKVEIGGDHIGSGAGFAGGRQEGGEGAHGRRQRRHADSRRHGRDDERDENVS